MSRKIAPITPPAETAAEAFANVETLLASRHAGWDRTAVRDIIRVCYGSTENFAKHHLTLLLHMAKTGKTWKDRAA